MKLARSLLFLSAVVFAVTAIGYLVVPGVMLSVVGVASNDTADFLIRTEGVALLAGAVFLWAARSGPPGLIGVVLGAPSPPVGARGRSRGHAGRLTQRELGNGCRASPATSARGRLTLVSPGGGGPGQVNRGELRRSG